jgi:copper chaperone CopZ
MITRTAFDLDCNPVIGECGFACSNCIQEIEATLTCIEGVSKVYMEGEAEEGKLIVEHDPAIAAVDQLIEAFKMLPTFYEGFFIPTVITV